MNDHRHFDSAIVRDESMPDGSEEVAPNQSVDDGSVDVPRNQSTHDSSADSADRDPAASAPTEPGYASTRAASESAAGAFGSPQPPHIDVRAEREQDIAASAPTQPGRIEASAASGPAPTGSSNGPDVQGSTSPRHLSDPSAEAPTRTSQPDRPAAQEPTRTGEPGAQAPTAVTPPPQPGVPQLRNPARYRILGEHGRGGLGKVSRAHDLELGRDIAIKELLSRSTMHEVRFMREALITARLEHPGIVPVHEAGRWPDGTPFYAMKLVAGRPLRDLLAERKTVDDRISLLHHVIAVADAIAYAHGRNIIHRDLKPGNVIVGDFGETVVIDWGLAKDLSSSEESTTGGGPLLSGRDDGLTSAGAVLGTPAYMAPEQKRGEPADPRADVYAIGAMLWELCSLEKMQADDRAQRRRILRKAGIDPDLIAIVDKALAADLDLRYYDAGALAADLKAFKAGARIAARRYSPWALLVHWTRRHRALAVSLACTVVMMIAGIALYVRSITAERDRADASEMRATRERALAQSSLDELTLKHAELTLTFDPSAALDLIKVYHGNSRGHADQIRAEGVGRGVALLRAKPHNDRVRWVAGLPDSSIISLSTDGSIARTRLDQTSIVLATDVSARGRFAYSQSRSLLAYACNPSDVCIWDVLHQKRFNPAPLKNWQLAGLSFSPDGTRLALSSYSGTINIFDVTTPEQPVSLLQTQRREPTGLLFADNNTLAIGLSSSFTLELTSTMGSTRSAKIQDVFIWDASPGNHRMALGTQHGYGTLVDTESARILTKTTLCHEAVSGLKFLPGHNTIAFACKEGTVGVWDPSNRTTTPLMYMEGHADTITVSEDGDYVAAANIDGSLVVIDLVTGLNTNYRGHGFRLTAVSAPTSKYPYFISADEHGALRSWPIPSRIARLSAKTEARFTSAIFGNDANDLITATLLHSSLTILSPPSGIRTASPHSSSAMYLEMTHDGSAFAAYGSSDSIELWGSHPILRQHTFNTGQGAISKVAFTNPANDLVSAGRDGRLVYWKLNGTQEKTIQVDSAITDMAITHINSALIATTGNKLYGIDPNYTIISLAPPASKVYKISPVGTLPMAAVVYANGDLRIFDTTTSWNDRLALHTDYPIREAVFSRDGHIAALVDEGNTIHVGYSAHSWITDQIQWSTFRAAAGKLALTTDGVLVAPTSSGGIWLYSRSNRTSIFLPTSKADFNIVAISPDERLAGVLDTDGRIILLDLEIVRQELVHITPLQEN